MTMSRARAGTKDLEGGAPGFSNSPGEFQRMDLSASSNQWSSLVSIGLVAGGFGGSLMLFGLGEEGRYLAASYFACFVSLAFAVSLIKYIVSYPSNDPSMHIVADAIREGSEGFLRVQYGTIARFSGVVCIGIFVVYMNRPSSGSHLDISVTGLAVLTSISFLLGAFCSALAGWVGVWISVRCNIKVAAAAARGSVGDTLKMAFCGGAVSAIISAAMCVLGLGTLYAFCFYAFVVHGSMQPASVPLLLVGYGFGASFVALFMQLGGGIYTKAADVGADMIGKVESGIPEDDHRNPAVIADLVGDNVGDCAGSMADVFESIAAEIIGTMILGAQLTRDAKIKNVTGFLFFPLIVHTIDLIVSSIGVIVVKYSPNSMSDDPLKLMRRAYAVAALLALVAYYMVTHTMLVVEGMPDVPYYYFLCGLVGIATSYLLIIITQYYTDYDYGPVRSIANASVTGHGTNIIAGMSVGFESTALPVLVVSGALLGSYTLGTMTGLPAPLSGLFGTAAATMGMLGTAVFVLSMNNFGPIADNAGGIVEMSLQPDSVRVITDKLDAVGNVTKAATKGYAVGGSALACFILFRAYLDEVSEMTGVPMEVVDIAKVDVLVGGLLGMMMIFLFVGWAMKAVGTTAQEVVKEVRRQFKNKPGILENTERPEYDVCVAIVTKAALREMKNPALLALGFPVMVGVLFRFIGAHTGRPMLAPEVLSAFMMLGSMTGLLMAIFLDNAGGAWDNAKKYVESGFLGGKGSEAHKAAVTGDTVGDPCKDTAGPALHVIITTMSTTIIVLGPLFLNNP